LHELPELQKLLISNVSIIRSLYCWSA